MMVSRKILLANVFFVAVLFASAQSKLQLLQRATIAYEDLEYYSAAKLFESYNKIDSTDQKVISKIANCYWNMRQYDHARIWYGKLSVDTVAMNSQLSRRIAELYAMEGAYAKAAAELTKTKGLESRIKGFLQKDRFLKDSADWRIEYLNINTPKYREFSPMLIGSSIIWSTNEPKRKNSDDIYGWDANGFVRQKFLPNKADIGVRDVPSTLVVQDSIKKRMQRSIARTYAAADVSIRSKGYLSKSFLRTRKLRMSQPQDLKIFNKLQYNVGHATASASASKMYLTVNRQDKISNNATRSLGIVEADIMGSYIANPVFVPISSVNDVDSNEVILHGAIDPMGKYLVFSSNRAGGKGGFDLYASIRSLDGKWSAPEALESLNSPGDEVFSAFSSNGDLYFSSNGRAGLGGLDIYKVKTTIAPFSMALLFQDPEHLSYPINSDHDDFGLVLSENSQKGYFTSDRHGSDDIFSFDFEKKYVTLSGSVIDRSTNLRAQSISVSLYEVAEDGKIQIVDSVETDKNGVYTFSSARPNKEYVIKVYEPINEDGVQNVTVVKSSTEPDGIERGLAVASVEYTKPASANVGMSIASNANITEVEKATKDQPVAVNNSTPTVINQPLGSLNKKSTPELSSIGNGFKEPVPSDSFYAIVYFGFDLDNITIRAVRTLDSVVAYMRANPQDEFMLLGHADEVGDLQYNIDLSKRRVIQVIRYIGSKGIDTKRLKLSYYGENKPAQTNATSKEYLRLNRRVEFLLIKK